MKHLKGRKAEHWAGSKGEERARSRGGRGLHVHGSGSPEITSHGICFDVRLKEFQTRNGNINNFAVLSLASVSLPVKELELKPIICKFQLKSEKQEISKQ